MKKFLRFLKKNFILIITFPIIICMIWAGAVRCSALSGDYDVNVEELNHVVTHSYFNWNTEGLDETTFSASLCTASPSLVSMVVHYVLPMDIFYNVSENRSADAIDLNYIQEYFHSFMGYSIPALTIGDGVSYSVNYANLYVDYPLYSNYFEDSGIVQGDLFTVNRAIFLNVTVTFTCYPDLYLDPYQIAVGNDLFSCGDYFSTASGVFLNLNFSNFYVPFENGDYSLFRIQSDLYSQEALCYYRVWITDILCPANNPIYSNVYQNELYGIFCSSYDNYISSTIYYAGYTGYNNKGSVEFKNNILGFGDSSITANKNYLGETYGLRCYTLFFEGGGSYDFKFSGLRITHNYYESSGKRFYAACTVNKKSSGSLLPSNVDIKHTCFAWTYTQGENVDVSSVGSGTSSNVNTKDLYITIDYNFRRDGITPIFTRVLPQAFNNALIWFMTEAPVSNTLVNPLFSTVAVVTEFFKGYISPVFVACGAIGGVFATVLIIAVVVKRFL